MLILFILSVFYFLVVSAQCLMADKDFLGNIPYCLSLPVPLVQQYQFSSKYKLGPKEYYLKISVLTVKSAKVFTQL